MAFDGVTFSLKVGRGQRHGFVLAGPSARKSIVGSIAGRGKALNDLFQMLTLFSPLYGAKNFRTFSGARNSDLVGARP